MPTQAGVLFFSHLFHQFSWRIVNSVTLCRLPTHDMTGRQNMGGKKHRWNRYVNLPRFPIGQGSRYLGRRGRRGGGTSRVVRSRSCWRQEPLHMNHNWPMERQWDKTNVKKINDANRTKNATALSNVVQVFGGRGHEETGKGIDRLKYQKN